jgi:hypothetical protein
MSRPTNCWTKQVEHVTRQTMYYRQTFASFDTIIDQFGLCTRGVFVGLFHGVCINVSSYTTPFTETTTTGSNELSGLLIECLPTCQSKKFKIESRNVHLVGVQQGRDQAKAAWRHDKHIGSNHVSPAIEFVLVQVECYLRTNI